VTEQVPESIIIRVLTAHPESIIIRVLTAPEARERVPDLSAVLIDCVEGGASVSFMAPLTRERADGFWRRVADGVASDTRLLIVAEEQTTGEIVGTVQLLLDLPENQPHRADVAKMLVRRSARRRGLGGRLMGAVEDAARGAGRALLVLDTVTGDDAERLYTRLGWTRVGVIPDYALWPDGRPCDTTVFYKRLPSAPAPHGPNSAAGTTATPSAFR
jgi:GNAT superfamily N-acetyltransferase